MTDEREAAWQRERSDKPAWWPRAPFDAGWDAAREAADERLAVLVNALQAIADGRWGQPSINAKVALTAALHPTEDK